MGNSYVQWINKVPVQFRDPKPMWVSLLTKLQAKANYIIVAGTAALVMFSKPLRL